MTSFPKLDLVFIQTTQSGQDANDRKWCSEHSSSVGDTQPTTAPVPRELSAHTTVKELKREERVGVCLCVCVAVCLPLRALASVIHNNTDPGGSACT